MIRIFIIEDHPVTVAGLRTYCRPQRDHINVVENAITIEEALKVKAETFDVIFLDLWLSEVDPIINVENVKTTFPGKPIIMYSGEKELYWQRKCYRAGVKGFLDKNASRSLVHETVRRVMAGEVVYSATMTEFRAERIITCHKDPKYGLTDQQKKIIGYFVQGHAPKDIAEILDKNLTTVNRDLKVIREKFMVLNNYDLMRSLLNVDEFKKKDTKPRPEPE